MTAENRSHYSGDALQHTDRQHRTAHRHLTAERAIGKRFILVTFDEIAGPSPAKQEAN